MTDKIEPHVISIFTLLSKRVALHKATEDACTRRDETCFRVNELHSVERQLVPYIACQILRGAAQPHTYNVSTNVGGVFITLYGVEPTDVILQGPVRMGVSSFGFVKLEKVGIDDPGYIKLRLPKIPFGSNQEDEITLPVDVVAWFANRDR